MAKKDFHRSAAKLECEARSFVDEDAADQADRRAAMMLAVNALQGATREAAGSKVRSTAAHPAAELADRAASG